MSTTSSVPEPWRVADATFVEIEIHRPSDRQMRVEFACGLRLVITGNGVSAETGSGDMKADRSRD